MSIRLRLTLLYTLVLAVTLVLFSVTIYVAVSQATHHLLQEGIAADTARLIETPGFRIDNMAYLPVGKGKPIPLNSYVQTLDLNGRLLDRSAAPSLEGIDLPSLSDADLQHIRSTGYTWTTAMVLSGQWLIYSKRVKDDRGHEGIVQVARPTDDQLEQLTALRTQLITGSLLAIALAFGLGWLLSHFALQPIDRITRTARTIGAQRDFGQRVNYAGPADEIGKLAGTFNAMLGELQSAYEQTASALQAQRRFVADASHELRTPLTTIRGNLGLLAREPPIGEEDRRAALDDMVAEAERMSRLINNLLTLARADTGQPPQTSPLAIDPLLDDLCRQAQRLAPERTIRCPAASGVIAIANRDMLQQILLILLDNALKHTPPTAQIAFAITADTETCALTVSDTGPGLPSDALAHIFERFYRGDGTRTGNGATLGMSECLGNRQAKAGALRVASTPGQGSAFSVTLPLATRAAEQPDVIAADQKV